MKKRGFTLVELLAVLVLIAAISLIVFPSIINYINSHKKEISDTTEKIIFSGAALYEDSHKQSLWEYKQYCIVLKDIVDQGFLDNPLIDSASGKEVDLNKFVEVTYQYDDTLKINKKNYKLVDECSNIPFVCVPANRSNLTVGSIPTNDYKAGEEYICKVTSEKEYHFLVLNRDGSKLSLIMDSNISKDGNPIKESNVKSVNDAKMATVSWLSLEDFEKSSEYNQDVKKEYRCTNYNICVDAYAGPITAFTFLHEATKDWNNISNININYTNEANIGRDQDFKFIGYQGIETNQNNVTVIKNKEGKTTASFTNLKARLPKISEVEEAGCKEEVANSCPDWLTEYIYDYQKYGSLFNDNYGYWLLASDSSSDGSAGSVSVIKFNKLYGKDGACYGTSLNETPVRVFYSQYYGVRPVIEISLDDVKGVN